MLSYCSTSGGATCDSVSSLTATRLSADIVSIEFRYFPLPDQIPFVRVLANNSVQMPEVDISDVVNIDQTFYKYIFTDVSNQTITYQFEINSMICLNVTLDIAVENYSGTSNDVIGFVILNRYV